MQKLAVLALLAATLVASAQDASVYAGRTAEDWASDLKKIDFSRDFPSKVIQGANGVIMQLPTDVEYRHIKQALSMLAEESIKPLATAARATRSADAHKYILEIFDELRETTKEQMLAGLLELLKDEHFSVRMIGARALGNRFGKEPQVVPALTALLKDKDKAVIEAAEESLERIKQLELTEKAAKAQAEAVELDNVERQTIDRLRQLKRANAVPPPVPPKPGAPENF